MKYSYFLHCALALSVSLATASSFASSFGIYDARTQAMGGTAVAVGTVNNGHFYNPALTAFHIGSEETTRDGRRSLHIVGNLVSKGTERAASTISERLDGELGDIIDRLNRSESPYQDAEDGFSLTAELSNAMSVLDDLAVGADVYVGYSISEPSDRKGGAFYIGTRIFATGIANIEDSDFDLVNDYAETFDFIRSQGASGELHADLIGNDGQLLDSSSRISSSAVGTAAAKSEIAMSFSKIYTFGGQEFSIGAAPKIVHLNVYDTIVGLDDGNLVNTEANTKEAYFNLDLGVALNLGDSFRVGFAIKDFVEKKVTTELNNTLLFGTYKRIGMAYFHPRFTFGVDLDLGSSPDLQLNTNRKDVSGGLEMKFKEHFLFRLGYRRDLQGILKDTFSTGLAWNYKYIAIEAAYTTNSESQGGGIEISYIH